ncbi:MAG TPA: MFS transporter [Jatrophihabitans sp.]|nr:MFS transporter [Jatrophihabitans sp.]
MSTSQAPTVTAAQGQRNEWLLVSFTATTNIADGVIKVALPLLAVRMSHSPIVITTVAAALSLPWLIAALHVGVFVDRLNRRTLMIGAETVRMLSVAVLLATFLSHTLTLPLIYAMAFVLGVAEVVALVSAASIVPSAVPRRHWQRASARITGMEYLCNGFLGAPVGGFLVAAGFGLALISTGSIYIVGAILLALLAGNFAVRSTTARRAVHEEIKDGLGFLWQHRLLRTMALLITVMAGCWAAWLALIPVYAVGGPLQLTARQYGLLLACLGAGGVAGSAVVGPVNRLLGRRWSMFVDIVGSFVLVGLPAVLPAKPAAAWAIGLAAFVAGAGGTMWTVNSRVITQSFVPQELLGRFSAASRLVSWGMQPVAAATAGALALVSYRLAFGAFAVLCLGLVYPFLKVVTSAAIAPADEPEPADSALAATPDRELSVTEPTT